MWLETMLACWHKWLGSVKSAQALRQSLSEGDNLWIHHFWDAKSKCCETACFIHSLNAKIWQGMKMVPHISHPSAPLPVLTPGWIKSSSQLVLHFFHLKPAVMCGSFQVYRPFHSISTSWRPKVADVLRGTPKAKKNKRARSAQANSFEPA